MQEREQVQQETPEPYKQKLIYIQEDTVTTKELAIILNQFKLRTTDKAADDLFATCPSIMLVG